jgi:hypothetical protein
MDDDKNKNMTKRTTEEIDFTKPRDLYNRTNRLQTSLERVNELPNPDKDDGRIWQNRLHLQLY